MHDPERLRPIPASQQEQKINPMNRANNLEQPELLIQREKVINDETIKAFLQVVTDERILLLAFCLASNPGEWTAEEIREKLISMQGVSSKSTTEDIKKAKQSIGSIGDIRFRFNQLPKDLFYKKDFEKTSKYSFSSQKPQMRQEFSSFCKNMLFFSHEDLSEDILSFNQLLGSVAHPQTNIEKGPTRRWLIYKSLRNKLLDKLGNPIIDKSLTTAEIANDIDLSDQQVNEQLLKIPKSIVQFISHKNIAHYKLTDNAPQAFTPLPADKYPAIGAGGKFVAGIYTSLQILQGKYPGETHSLDDILTIFKHKFQFAKNDSSYIQTLKDRMTDVLAYWKELKHVRGGKTEILITSENRTDILVSFLDLIDNIQYQSDIIFVRENLFDKKIKDNPHIVTDLMEKGKATSAHNPNNINSIHEEIYTPALSNDNNIPAILQILETRRMSTNELAEKLHIPISEINNALHILENINEIQFIPQENDTFAWQLNPKIENKKFVTATVEMIKQLLDQGGIIQIINLESKQKYVNLYISNISNIEEAFVNLTSEEKNDINNLKRRNEISNQKFPFIIYETKDEINKYFLLSKNVAKTYQNLSPADMQLIRPYYEELLVILDKYLQKLYEVAYNRSKINIPEDKRITIGKILREVT